MSVPATTAPDALYEAMGIDIDMETQNAQIELDFLASLLNDNSQWHDVNDVSPALLGDESVRALYPYGADRGFKVAASAFFATLNKDPKAQRALDEISLAMPPEHQVGTPDQIRENAVNFIYRRGRRAGPAVHLAEIIRNNAGRRMVDQAIRNIRPDQFRSSHEYAQAMASQLTSIANRMAPNASSQSLSTGIDEAAEHFLWVADHPNQIQGIKIGLGDYDEAMGGLQPGELIGIGGHSGEGKTQLKGFMALHAAIIKRDDTQKPSNVAYFSLEMSPREMAARWISNRSGVSLRERHPTPDQRRAVQKAAKELRELSDSGRLICVEPKDASTLDQIVRTMHKLKEEYDIHAAFIDYAQLIRVTNGGESKYDQMASMSQRIKIATQQLDITTVMGMQLNREALTNNSQAGRPKMFHIADSMDLVRSADALQFIWTPARHLHGANIGDWGKIAVLLTEKVRARAKPEDLFYTYDFGTSSFAELNDNAKKNLLGAENQGLLRSTRSYGAKKDA